MATTLYDAPKPTSELWRLIRAGDFDALTDRELYKLITWAVLALALALGLFFTFVNPAPPKVLAFSAGAKSGGYYAFATRYQQALKKHGITLHIIESKGSMQNLERLRAKEVFETPSGKLPVMAAFVQSGTNTDADLEAGQLESLASVGNEPIWVFHRLNREVTRLADLKGQRVGVDVAGSGTQFAALKLLEKAGITAQNSTLVQKPGSDVLQAMAEGTADAVLLVASPASDVVKSAFERQFKLVSFDQADGFVRNFAWLRKVVVPRGALDLATDLPAQDVTLIAATANLAVHADLHPSLAFLLMDVAAEVHAAPSIAQSLREFPSQVALTLAQSEESKRYFASGRPFLQRYLPFWLANWVERILTSFVPVLLVALPLIKAVPAFTAWREKAHVSRIYLALKKLEDRFNQGACSAPETRQQLAQLDAELVRLEAQSSHLSELFNAREQIETMRKRLQV